MFFRDASTMQIAHIKSCMAMENLQMATDNWKIIVMVGVRPDTPTTLIILSRYILKALAIILSATRQGTLQQVIGTLFNFNYGYDTSDTLEVMAFSSSIYIQLFVILPHIPQFQSSSPSPSHRVPKIDVLCLVRHLGRQHRDFSGWLFFQFLDPLGLLYQFLPSKSTCSSLQAPPYFTDQQPCITDMIYPLKNTRFHRTGTMRPQTIGV